VYVSTSGQLFISTVHGGVFTEKVVMWHPLV
jgi:hypothetical protein